MPRFAAAAAAAASSTGRLGKSSPKASDFILLDFFPALDLFELWLSSGPLELQASFSSSSPLCAIYAIIEPIASQEAHFPDLPRRQSWQLQRGQVWQDWGRGHGLFLWFSRFFLTMGFRFLCDKQATSSAACRHELLSCVVSS